jgi:flagellar basal body rod protein FlgC
MGYLDSLNITGSALTAERFRTDIILQNLANQNTTRTAEGGNRWCCGKISWILSPSWVRL